LAPRFAFPLGSDLRLPLAEDLLAGLDFVAMVFLIGAHPSVRARLSRYPNMGAAWENRKL
jgi:hypothetical protein